MNSLKRRCAALLIATSFVAGCATAPSDQNACPPVKPYEQSFLDQAADELDLLPDGSAVEEMLKDYAVMRDQARACR